MYTKTSEAEMAASALIDGEYENLIGMTEFDMFDYLSSYPACRELTREESDKLFRSFGFQDMAF